MSFLALPARDDKRCIVAVGSRPARIGPGSESDTDAIR
jgi:hypothetical protein